MAARKKPLVQLEITSLPGERAPRAFLTKWVALMADEVAREIGVARVRGLELTCAFVPAEAIRELNLEYLGRDYATDVLSFNLSDTDSSGELALCLEVIRRQASEHELTVNEELGYMVLHGFLHLLGYEHERSKAKAKIMFDLQDRVFERMLERL